MFKNRKLIILSALLMLVVLIGCASAADVNDIQQVTQDSAGEIITDEVSSAGIDDNSGLEELENENVLNSQNENSEDDVLTADISVTGNTFQDIQYAIDRASDGDTIYLESPLYTGSGTQINVNKNLLTIIGCEGCTLTNTNGRIFNVTGSNVTLKNIAFENGTSNTNIMGGAIHWSGANGTVSNCNFTKNQISRLGGAIYWTGANGTVSNCYFTNNTARSGGYGGAIYWTGANATISDNFFIKNGAIAGSGPTWGYGGAIYLTGANANISNCEFTDGNSEPYSIAGAIYCTGANPTIFNSSFTNNRAVNAGIYLYSNKGIVSISSCNFTENRASGTGTGAIELINTTSIISDCDFKSNRGYYGAISWTIGNGTISNCNFTDNYGGHTGGAIELDYFNGTVSNCNFIGSRANYYYGGAINCLKSNVTISDSNFTNNSAPEGGAIHWSGSDINVSNCNFTNNKVVKSTDRDGSALCYGGAISGGGSNNTVSNCNFTNNTAKYGGAIYIVGNEKFTLNDNDFIGNVANISGGAIYCKGNNTISNSNFTYNIAVTGSAIYMNSSDESKISDSYFMDNRANSTKLIGTLDDPILKLSFTGKDNYINAIYSENEISFNNVIYWNGSVVNSDVATPDKSDYEKGINITLEIYDANGQLVDNITQMTDAEGNIYYDRSNINKKCTYKAYHSEDTYYTYIETKGTLPADPILTINKTANDSIVSTGSLVNFTIEVSNIGKYDTPVIIIDSLYDSLYPPYGMEFIKASEGWYDYYKSMGWDSPDLPVIPAWNITNLAAGQNITVWVVAKAISLGSYTNHAYAEFDNKHIQDSATVTVPKIGTIVTVDKIVNYTGAVVEVIANVTDANGNPINGGTATFTIHYDNPIGLGLLMANAKEYTTDVIDGKATFKDVTLGAPGKYQSTIEYSGNGNYDSASDKSEVEILALNTTVESDDVSGSSGEKTDIVAEIVDQNGKPVQNGTAVLKVNGKEYTAEVKDGKATFKDVELPSEDTEATIEYLGNDYYNPSNATVQITINEEPQPEPDDGNETEPDTTPEESGESEGSQTAAMEKTGNPLFLLIVAVLACLPILRRKQ